VFLKVEAGGQGRQILHRNLILLCRYILTSSLLLFNHMRMEIFFQELCTQYLQISYVVMVVVVPVIKT
jgi:hypothetical protein